MSKKRKYLIAFLTAMSLTFIGSGSAIYAMSETIVTNHLSTGVVDIELNDKAEIPQRVLPGQDIPGAKEIINAGDACFVRAKIQFRDASMPMEESVYGMPEAWEYHDDGYWYYTDAMETGETLTLFSGFTVPEEYPQDEEGGAFFLDVDVDAIQSRNFTPDFETDSPWGNVAIERCIREDGNDITILREASEQDFTITYEGDAEKLFAEPEDFFSNLPTLLPGDAYTDHAILKNNSDRDIILYFRSDAKHTELLDAVNMTGKLAGKVFYDWTLAGTFKEELTIPAGEEVNLEFTISVPSSLQNAYTLLSDQVKWTFSTVPIEPAAPQTGVPDTVGLILIGLGLISGSLAVSVKRKAGVHA